MSKKHTTIATAEVEKVLAVLKAEIETKNYDQVVRRLLRGACHAVP
jgi:hypothetical protein